jgi:two-component system sensor histidine kinase/response regulator
VGQFRDIARFSSHASPKLRAGCPDGTVKSTGISDPRNDDHEPTSTAPLLRSPPTFTAESADEAPVDVSILESILGGNWQLVDEVLREFCDCAIALGRKLIECCGELKATEAAEIAHKLKSSARAVGALKLGELCEAIERAGNRTDMVECARLGSQFQAELAAVTLFLHGLQRQSVA